MTKKRKKNGRGTKTKAQVRDAKRAKELHNFLGGGRGLSSDEEPTGGVIHHSRRKTDAEGMPLYGRSLISQGAMAILLRKKK